MNTTHANNSHALWQKAYQEAGIVPQLKAPEYSNLAALVHDMCTRYAAQDPKKKAYTCVVPNGMNGNLTFKQVDEMSDAFAGYLRAVLGLQAGDRVAVQLPNSLSYPIVAFGIMKAGCVLVNTNPLYTESEMIHQFNDSGAKALVIIDMFANKLPEVLAKTQIKHVVVADVTAFFPAVPRRVIRLVQKVWNRVLPSITVPHERIASALKKGAASLAQTPAKTYWEHIRADEMALLQYTGGTTGVSKGAVLTHSNLLNNVNQMLAMGGTHMQIGTECVLTALPIYHIFAFTANLLGFLVIGARNILIPSPRPVQNLQRAIENYPVTWMTGVNTLYNALLNEEWFLAYPPKNLKASIAGGTALHFAVAQRWREVTNTPIAEGYGLTETSPVVTFNPLSGRPRNGIGIPAPGTEVRLVGEDGQLVGIGEPGEIQVKGPQVMKSYWQQDQETAKVLNDGWLSTGDVAMMDEEGYLRIVDRKKDMILVSGFNVYPNEVEDVIAQMDAVLEVAVVGVPDPVSGEAVRAYVVPNPEHDGELKTADVIAHCKSQLTNYKVPHQVLIRHDLPKTPIGKVLRKTLRAEALAEMGAPRQ